MRTETSDQPASKSLPADRISCFENSSREQGIWRLERKGSAWEGLYDVVIDSVRGFSKIFWRAVTEPFRLRDTDLLDRDEAGRRAAAEFAKTKAGLASFLQRRALVLIFSSLGTEVLNVAESFGIFVRRAMHRRPTT